jgi:uncharacterized ion transporter superfamily protein YfcC
VRVPHSQVNLSPLRLPHPLVLLGAAVLVAAALTWIVPAGEYERKQDVTTGRTVVVSGTFHAVQPAPVGLLAAVVAIPRGFVEAADVVAVVVFVGGAWVLADRLGALPAAVDALVGLFADRGILLIPVVSLFFAVMGALENMEEEIIPLIPALVVLGDRMGLDAITVVAMSFGAAMVGATFGPTNPFQAGIALKLAQLPPLSAAGLRLGMFAVAFVLWVAWTMVHARRTAQPRPSGPLSRAPRPETRASSPLVLVCVVLPMAAYVYGALKLDWGFNELSALFVIGAIAAGLVGGLGLEGTVTTFVSGMQELLPAALMVGVARSISLVLSDGHIVDTILHTMVTALSGAPAIAAAILMVPFHALVHIAVPSVSGQAVLTMPLMVPLADVIGMSRQVPVLAYQTGAGLMELATPTNGALMAVLLAARVPWGRWMRFAIGALALLVLVGIAGIVLAAAAR